MAIGAHPPCRCGKFRHKPEIFRLRSHRPVGRGLRPTSIELLMTPQDKRERARKLRGIAASRSRVLATEILELARRLEQAADEQERDQEC